MNFRTAIPVLCLVLVLAIAPNPSRAAWESGFQLQGLAGDVHCVLDWQGTLIAGGALTFAGDVPVRNIAACTDGTWHPLGEGLTDEVLDLVLGDDGPLALMRKRGDTTYWVLEVMHWNGASWTQLGPDYYATGAPMAWYHGAVHLGKHRLQDGAWVEVLSADAGVGNLAVCGDELIFSGNFLHAGGLPATYVAAWRDGEFRALGAGLPRAPEYLAVDGDRLHALCSYDSDDIMMSCEVRTWDGAAWTTSSRLGSAWNGYQGLVIHDGSILVFGSYGSTIDSPTPTCMASTNGVSWAGMTWLDYQRFEDFCVQGDRLIAVGSFSDVEGVASAGAIAYDPGGWQGLFPSGDGIRLPISQLRNYQGTLVTAQVGPGCGIYDPRYEILAWNGSAWSLLAEFDQGHVESLLSDGQSLALTTAWTPFGDRLYLFYDPIFICPVPDVPAIPTLYHDGALYAPGPVLYRYADGAWSALTTTADGEVGTLASWSGSLVASGPFTMIDGVALGHIGAYADGVWEPLGSGLDAPADLLAVWDGKLVAQGAFTTAGGLPAAGLAAFDGHDWIPLCTTAVDGEIHALCGYAGTLFAGGEFSHLDGVAARNVARFDGVSWQPLGAGADGPVRAMAREGWKLHLVGDFTSIDGRASHHVAVWQEPTVAGELAYFRADRTPSGVRLSWRLRDHDPGLSYVLRRHTVHAANDTEIAVSPAEDPDMTCFDAGAEAGELTYELATGNGSSGIVLGSVTLAAATPAMGTAVLEHAVPNPFNPVTEIAYTLDGPTPIRLAIHDAKGRRVKLLELGVVAGGRHTVVWNGCDDRGRPAPSGVYFARLSAAERIRTIKLMLAR